MNRNSHFTKTLKVIFSFLFVYLTLGDWHIHAAATHQCEEEHTSVHSDFKWQTHEACENSEDIESHEDYKQALAGVKILVQLEVSPRLATPILQATHQGQCQDCLVQVELNQLMLSSTLLLI